MEIVIEAPGATSLAADERDIFWSDGKVIHSIPVGGRPSLRHLDPQGARSVVKLRVVGERLFILQKDESDEPCRRSGCSMRRRARPR